MTKYPALSREFLEDVLALDRDAGKLFWLSPSKYHSEKTGQEAGCARKNSNGKTYWHVKINGLAYRRSYLVYCMTTDKWPAECIDHIDGNSLNDRPSNLREATVMQNAWNHKGRRKNTDLPMGIRRMPSNKYQARIACNKKTIYLGCFDSVEEAVNRYAEKRKELYGEFA